jgi:hypothetical protein
MTKKLTITVSDEVYEGLHRRVGRRKISRYLDNLARQHVLDHRSPDYWLHASDEEIERGYAEQAEYEAAHAGQIAKEDEAWLNGLIGDVLRTEPPDEKR